MRSDVKLVIGCCIVAALGCGSAGNALADPPAPVPEAQRFVGFPHPPSDPTADPKIRHAVTFQLPTSIAVSRNKDSIAIAFTHFKPVTITVGLNMITGAMCGTSLYLSTESQQPPELRELEGGEHLVFESETDTIPHPDREYVVERQLTVFETDEPTQHMWSPQSGKHYQVLWSKIFKATVK